MLNSKKLVISLLLLAAPGLGACRSDDESGGNAGRGGSGRGGSGGTVSGAELQDVCEDACEKAGDCAGMTQGVDACKQACSVYGTSGVAVCRALLDKYNDCIAGSCNDLTSCLGSLPACPPPSGGGGSPGGMSGGGGSTGGMTGGGGSTGGMTGGGGSPGTPYTGNIRGARMNPLADGNDIVIESAVIVGFKGNNKTMYIQDEGGGEYSGIAVFCNFDTNCTAWDRMVLMSYARGDKVKITGFFDRFQPSMPAGAPEQYQIKPVRVEKLTGTAMPVAANAPAAELAKNATNNAKWKGVYVKVQGGPFNVTSLMPMEMLNTGYQPCMMDAMGMQVCCSSGPRYGGFEVTGGILVATDFYRSSALSDMECARMEDRVVLMSDVFTSLGGVFDDSFGTQQLGVVVDADYMLQ